MSFWIFWAMTGFFKWLWREEKRGGGEKCLMHNKCPSEVIEAVNAEGPANKSCPTYSLSAWGSFCICSRIMRMAGSLMICCTSGSAIARFFTSSGLSFLIAWLTMQRWMPSDASWEARQRVDKWEEQTCNYKLQSFTVRICLEASSLTRFTINIILQTVEYQDQDGTVVVEHHSEATTDVGKLWPGGHMPPIKLLYVNHTIAVFHQ